MAEFGPVLVLLGVAVGLVLIGLAFSRVLAVAGPVIRKAKSCRVPGCSVAVTGSNV